VNDAVFEENTEVVVAMNTTMRVRVSISYPFGDFQRMDEGLGKVTAQNSNQTKKAANRRPRLTFIGNCIFTLH